MLQNAWSLSEVLGGVGNKLGIKSLVCVGNKCLLFYIRVIQSQGRKHVEKAGTV